MKNISPIEKTQILELHSKYKKKTLVEQTQPTSNYESYLNDVIKFLKLENAKVVPMNNQEEKRKFAIKQVSPTSGNIRYSFIDGTVLLKDIKNKKDIIGSWKVPSQEEIGTVVIKPKYNPKQQAFVDAWTGSSPDIKSKVDLDLFKIDPTPADFATGFWRPENYFIADNSESYFPADDKGVAGLKIYFNNSKLNGEITKKNCQAKIHEFTEAFNHRNTPLSGETPQWIAYTRAFVTKCINNIDFGAGSKKEDNTFFDRLKNKFSNTDEEIKILKGDNEDGVPSGSPFRIYAINKNK